MIDQWWLPKKKGNSFIHNRRRFWVNFIFTQSFRHTAVHKRMYILTYARNPINSRERCWNEVENNLLKTLYFSFLHGHLWFPVHFRKCVFKVGEMWIHSNYWGFKLPLLLLRILNAFCTVFWWGCIGYILGAPLIFKVNVNEESLLKEQLLFL